MTPEQVLQIAAQGVAAATPYLLAALGETFGQRAGVFNLGVDGVMLMGAFSGFYVALQTGSPLLGVAVAMWRFKQARPCLVWQLPC